MEQDHFMWLVVGAVIVQAGGLVGKIVYDWLRQPQCNGICQNHGELMDRVKKVETCTTNIKKDVATHDALIDEHNTTVLRRLQEGGEKMTEMSKAIEDIGKSVAVLLDRTKQRRITDAAPE